MPDVNPEEFDIDSWLEDAHLPEESVTVYQRGDLVSDLTELQRQIEIYEDGPDGPPSTGGRGKLESRYRDLAQKFHSSGLTIYVRATTADERKALVDESNAADEAAEEFQYRLLAASIIGVKPADGERKSVTFTQEKVRKLHKSIGEPQTVAIVNAQRSAANSIPAVSADFLHKLSSPASGAES